MIIMERVAAVLAGSMLVGVGINFFLIPYQLMDGGMIGIGLIFHYYIGLPTGLGIILSSIPLYLYAWHFEKKLFLNSLHGLLFSSLCIDIFSDAITGWNLPIYVSAVIGGALIGLGIGLMLRYGTSTGGTDMLAQIISRKSGINVGLLIFFIDGCVLLFGLSVVDTSVFFYSFLTIITVAMLTSVTVMRTT
ncbi:YitT family protein [Peribacillus muralis]|uniref:YitT family protein n=1 Tax=Peribacillus muralis TaxID=264697 RepID=UPI000A588A6D|nr:YitT family protein [Peribacillus muralis]MCK1993037.1 YitT family protein [Peribacillus muralis]MCK2013592.1 YitT family protein [Peribacillus muralis]